MKEQLRRLGLFAAAALIVGSIGQGILEWIFLSDASSQAAVSFARSSPLVAGVFREVHDIKVARTTDYGNAAEHRREREYVFSVAGILANGTVVVIDIAPTSGHRYEIGEIETHDGAVEAQQ